MLPLTEANTIRAAKWLKENFGELIDEYTHGTPYDFKTIAAIFCQETAQRVLLWIDKYDPQIILQRCVFDATGDYPGTFRYAFPRNRADLEASKFGKDTATMLVEEANKQRVMPQPGYPNGYRPASYLYKGYGIFQYDLQNIQTDPDFFLQKKWYNMSDCLQKLIEILNGKINSPVILKQILAAYNGSGIAAASYGNNVMQFRSIISLMK